MYNWKDRVCKEVKEKVNLDVLVETFKRKIEINKKNGMPARYATSQARKAMMVMLEKKGVPNSKAVHLLHVCEVGPYSGCCCCEHRRLLGSSVEFVSFLLKINANLKR
jgi:hypothetical protein